ncbi:MAG: CRISPR-associated helicase Cas3' [Hominimerdicola sp.]
MLAAHIRRNKNGEIEKEQSVKAHCLGAQKLSGDFAEKLGFVSIAKLAALIHDMGKLANDFNGYIHGTNNFKRGQIDHCYAGAKFITDYAKKFDGFKYSDTAQLIARTVVSHHGLHDWVTCTCSSENYFVERIRKSERYDEIKRNSAEFLADTNFDELFKKAADEYEILNTKILDFSQRNCIKYCFYMGMFERLLQSVIVDSDRIDTAEFMENQKLCLEYNPKSVWDKMYENIQRKNEEFIKFTDKISIKRMSISDRCAEFAQEKHGICRLVVPTGGGKTISSMRFAVNYCKKFGMDRIFYIAPFMSILEQNSDVIKSIVGDERLFLEFHSNIVSKIDDAEELAEYELRTDLWDCPVIATTMVQFLNTLFSNKLTSVRRMHKLSRSVIIIDEVQSVPLKCVNLFNLAMNFLAKFCDCTIVLCSATQPVFEDLEYEIMLDKEDSMTGDYKDDFEDFKRTETISAVRAEQYSFEQAADFCIEKFNENGNVLMIVNTKKAAAEIYNCINQQKIIYNGQKARIIHISTSMCPCHRTNTLDEIRRLLDEKVPVICITTQLIEAGVDISFNCVVRSLAGLDSAAQAAGRCNRHGRDKCRPVYLINIKDENLGRLKQIKEAQDISRQLIDYSPESFADTETMSLYFKKLYNVFKSELNYNVNINGTLDTILDLLSVNKLFNSETHHVADFNKAQAFATAGKKIEVISNNTLNVIVPYNDEAKNIIERLNCDIDYNEEKELLRKAQKYIVGIYSYTAQKLRSDDGIYELNDKGIFASEDRFYSSELGLTSKPAELEFLNF